MRITGWKGQRAERATEGKHEHMNDGLGVHGAAESRVPDMGQKDPTRQAGRQRALDVAWQVAGKMAVGSASLSVGEQWSTNVLVSERRTLEE